MWLITCIEQNYSSKTCFETQVFYAIIIVLASIIYEHED